MITPPSTGTLTFLFTDIEGSTQRWEHQREAMSAALVRHDALVRGAIEGHGGHVFKTVGDAFCATFVSAAAALLAALQAQRALIATDWSAFGEGLGDVRVRMAIHVGEAERRGDDYFGPTVNRVARLLAIGHGGQILLSEVAHALVRDELPPDATLRDMGRHRLKDLAREERVYQPVIPGLPSEFPTLRSLDLRPHNLPVQLTSFVGREREVEEVKSLLSQTRLVTLTGIGGAGKTRLGLQVAAELVEAHPDGTWFVDLSATTDGDMVAQAIATVLRVRPEPGRAIEETVVRQLQDRDILLVLDNCEQVVDACGALVARLLTGAERLRILATSRETLRVPGETVRIVPPMTVPEADLTGPGDHLLLDQYEAVRLFVDRAKALNAGFAVSVENGPAIAALTVQLEGIPLAIELAAARTATLSVGQILARLDERFRILSRGARTAPRRQQTLEATIAWSHDLLEESERVLFRRLGVFRGGWSLEAAEAVCVGEGTSALVAEDVLDLLDRLVGRSLVAVQDGPVGDLRYRMLETVREYAQRVLVEAGEREVTANRHLAYYLDLSRQAEAGLRGVEQGAWRARLNLDRSNLRAAVAWSGTDGGRAGDGLRLVGRLGRYLSHGDQCLEGVSLAELALSAAGPDADPAALAAGLSSAGGAYRVTGDLDKAEECLTRAVDLSRSAGDLGGASFALHNLGNVYLSRGNLPEARHCLTESLEIKEALGDIWGAATSRNNLGIVAQYSGDLVEARGWYESALTSAQAIDDVMMQALAIDNLGNVAWQEGDHATARRCFEEGLALNRRAANADGIRLSLNNVGVMLEAEGDLAGARAAYGESVALSREAGDRPSVVQGQFNLAGLAFTEGDHHAALEQYWDALVLGRSIGLTRYVLFTLCKIAEVLTAQGRYAAAVRVAATGEGHLAALGISLPGPLRDSLSAAEAMCREVLGPAAFDEAWAECGEHSLDEAVAYAKAEVDGHA